MNTKKNFLLDIKKNLVLVELVCFLQNLVTVSTSCDWQLMCLIPQLMEKHDIKTILHGCAKTHTRMDGRSHIKNESPLMGI
jgi:hypothetical protein